LVYKNKIFLFILSLLLGIGSIRIFKNSQKLSYDLLWERGELSIKGLVMTIFFRVITK
jgi:hypothetical protein